MNAATTETELAAAIVAERKARDAFEALPSGERQALRDEAVRTREVAQQKAKLAADRIATAQLIAGEAKLAELLADGNNTAIADEHRQWFIEVAREARERVRAMRGEAQRRRLVQEEAKSLARKIGKEIQLQPMPDPFAASWPVRFAISDDVRARGELLSDAIIAAEFLKPETR